MPALSDESLPIATGLRRIARRDGRGRTHGGLRGGLDPAQLVLLDERRLVEAARIDADAFAELYRRYVTRIHAYAHRRSGSTTIADDVTSATFEKALRGLAGYRWRNPGIGPWLFRIAAHELVDVYRRSGRHADTVARVSAERTGNELTVDFEPAVIDGLRANDELRSALSKIAPRYQRALTLRYLADLTNEEAAAAMGVTRSTMAVVVHRAGIALRKAIEIERQHGSLRSGEVDRG